MYFALKRHLWLLPIVAVLSARSETPVNDARGNLEKWVETRQLTSKVRTDWQSDKELIEQSLALYERELKTVADKMGKISTNNVQVDKERLEAEALKKSAGESLARAREFSAQIEGKIRQFAPRLPAPLQEAIKPLLNRLPADPANTKMSAAERLQTVVGILNEMDKFNSAISLYNEKVKNDKGEEVAVETVYVGLGGAWFVNETGDFAGAGVPGPNGWTWTVQPGLADKVRLAIKIYRNEHSPGFVPLPVTVR
jgi:hypothetical protein